MDELIQQISQNAKAATSRLNSLSTESKDELIIKAARLAVLDIDTDKLEIYPKDTGSSPDKALKSAKELRDMGINIVIGPVFYKSLIYYHYIQKFYFL